MKMFQVTYKNGNWTENLPKIMDSTQTLITVYFNAEAVMSSVWDEIQANFPQSVIMGCSGAGEVRGDSLVDGEVVVTITQFFKSKLAFFETKISEGQDSEQVGEALAKEIETKDLKAIYLLSDGLHVNGTALIQGVRKQVGKNVVISGGLAGDGTRFEKTYVLSAGKPTEKMVSAVAFYGEHLQVISSSKGGWKSFGPVRVITKSKANIMHELDHKPALALYKEYLGDQAQKLPASALLFPLNLISEQVNSERNIVRTILSVNESNQSMTFAGDVPEGTTVRLMRSTHEQLIDAAHEVMKNNVALLSQRSPVLSLLVSCVGRRLVMGEHTDGEIETVFEQLPAGSVQTGFYSYGEIAPGVRDECDLHNQTMTITLIQESN